MRICHFVPGFGVGGTERMLVDIANIQSNSCSVSIVILNNIIDHDNISGLLGKIQVYQIGRHAGSRSLFDLARLWRVLWKIKPDIIHFHTDSAHLIPFSSAQKVLTVHSTGLKLNGFHRYKQIFAISDCVMKDMYSRMPHLPKNIKIITNGILPDKFKKRKNSYEDGKVKICQLGRLQINIKGQDILLKAIAGFLSANMGINLQVDFIGDGPSRTEMEALVLQLGLKKNVRFLGSCSPAYVADTLQEYDLLIQPSRYEGFGLVVAEAMAAGVPVLVSDIQGPMEIIEHGKYGYFFNTENVDSLIAAFSRVYGYMKSGSIKVVIDSAYEHVREKYNINRTAEQYLAEYSDFLSTRDRNTACLFF